MADGRPFDLIPLSEVKRRAVPWLWSGWVPANGVSLLVGDPKLGKSTLALGLAAKLSRGEIGDPNRAPTSIVVTGEDSVAEVVEPRVAAAGGKPVHVHVVDLTDPEMEFTLPENVPDLEHRVYEIGAQLVIVDPLNRFLAEAVDGHKDQSIRRAIGPLHQVAERNRCAIVVIAHLNKAMGANPLYRVGGSIGLTGAARSVMLFAKDPDDPDGERGPCRILAQAGSNYGRQQPSRRYVIEPILLPGSDGLPDVETIRLIDHGEVDVDASELLSVSTADDLADRDEAADFLIAELTDGPRPAADVQANAKRNGIGPGALKRAKRKLRVKSSKSGMGGGWWWELPGPKGTAAPEGDGTPEPSSSSPSGNHADSGVSAAEPGASSSSSSANHGGFRGPELAEIPEEDGSVGVVLFGGDRRGAEPETRQATPEEEERIARLLDVDLGPYDDDEAR
jgi:AAA domain